MTELENAGSDLVRILTRLTDDVQRFDSMVLSQRKMLEHPGAHLDDLDGAEFTRQAERISADAAEVVARARQALHELSLLGKPAERLTRV